MHPETTWIFFGLPPLTLSTYQGVTPPPPSPDVCSYFKKLQVCVLGKHKSLVNFWTSSCKPKPSKNEVLPQGEESFMITFKVKPLFCRKYAFSSVQKGQFPVSTLSFNQCRCRSEQLLQNYIIVIKSGSIKNLIILQDPFEKSKRDCSIIRALPKCKADTKVASNAKS